MTTVADPISEFQDAMASLGIKPRQPIQADGQLHRFDVEGDRKGTRNGFYSLHIDNSPAGMFGCWKRGIRETWKANSAPLSDFEHAELVNKIKAAERPREQAKAKQQKSVAKSAARLWDAYEAAPTNHPYLARKRIQPNGAMIDGQGRLVLALSDVDGAIWSLQTIGADGAKLFMVWWPQARVHVRARQAGGAHRNRRGVLHGGLDP